MTVELTRDEAELLIAVLMFAEGAAPVLEPAITKALADLRPWRSALLGAYVRSRCEAPQAVGAVDPSAADSGTRATRA